MNSELRASYFIVATKVLFEVPIKINCTQLLAELSILNKNPITLIAFVCQIIIGLLEILLT